MIVGGEWGASEPSTTGVGIPTRRAGKDRSNPQSSAGSDSPRGRRGVRSAGSGRALPTHEGDGEMIVVRVTDETKSIEGVPCFVVNDVVSDEDGQTIEDTDDWFTIT